jgi:hypothetical protein
LEDAKRMKSRNAWAVVALMVAVLGGFGCAKTEQPGGGQTTAAVPAATPDPHPPIGYLNTPAYGETVANKAWGAGWALDDSGVLQVTAAADNGAISPARIGDTFPGVKEAYPNMPDSDKAGFIFGIPDLPSGPHTLTVEIVAKDGGRIKLTRRFIV